MRTLSFLYFFLYYFNWLDVNLIVFTATGREVVLILLPFFVLPKMLSDREFRVRATPILIYMGLVMFLSLLFLFMERNWSVNALMVRAIVQMFRFGLSLFEIYIGFNLFFLMDEKAFVKMQYQQFIFYIILGLYQVIAYHLGLPSWGIGLEREEQALSAVGIRPNSLIGEPKEFSCYLIIHIFFAMNMAKYGVVGKGMCYLSVLLSLYLFYLSQSGNGLLSLVLLVVTRFLFSSVNIYYKFFLFSLALPGGAWFFNNIDTFLHRDNLLGIVSAIKGEGTIPLLYLMDDLVLLPILALLAYPITIFTGFGYGMTTFYAAEFMNYALWKSEGTVIDSNISLLSNLCNYGFLLIWVICSYVLKGYITFRHEENLYRKILVEHMFYSFVVCFFVLGARHGFMFCGIGYFMQLFLQKNQAESQSSI